MLDPIGRDEAQEMARRELEKPIYHRDRPSWLERVLDRVGDWLRDLFNRSADPTAHGNDGGWVSLVVILLLVAAAIALVVWLMWGRGNVRSRREALLEEKPTTARDHRAAAEEFAAAGDWPNAIRERLRAIARDLEERAVLAPEPGRTADELAAEAGEALPELAGHLRGGVRIFDDVWYGDRPGSAEEYAQMKALDDRVRATRPRPLDEDEDAALAGAGAEDGGLRW
ncbi:DUF4129 domain-containing protein [Actinomadura rugatobispora]|uniref:DUF4129 domain-containing protein n=1 Tax=Actinomadura rugatobispora TaxID=1994 RepID=A0ABW1AEL9_9ACTN|nr:DUF4129 domain-containing protein [Actinomadura rugatobispora]